MDFSPVGEKESQKEIEDLPVREEKFHFSLNLQYKSWIKSASSAISYFRSKDQEKFVVLHGEEYNLEEDEERLRKDFESCIWLTYRNGFDPLAGGLDNDAGWGCMVRSGQMILAEVLKRHLLTRDWRISDQSCDKTLSQIMSWFSDVPRDSSIFSIHKIMSTGEKYGVHPGQWLGPHTIAVILRDLVNHEYLDQGGSLIMVVAQDGFLAVDEIDAVCSPSVDFLTRHTHASAPEANSICQPVVTEIANPILSTDSTASAIAPTSETQWIVPKPYIDNSDSSDSSSDSYFDPDSDFNPSNKQSKSTISHTKGVHHIKRGRTRSNKVVWDKALFLLVPLRFGLEQLNTKYVPTIQEILRLRQSVGIIGGTPRHSMYFIGLLGKELIYLDPHTIRPFLDVTGDITETIRNTVSCKEMNSIEIERIDPSLAIGFYCKSRREFEHLRKELKKIGSCHELGFMIGEVRAVFDHDLTESEEEIQAKDYDLLCNSFSSFNSERLSQESTPKPAETQKIYRARSRSRSSESRSSSRSLKPSIKNSNVKTEGDCNEDDEDYVFL